MGNDYVLGVDFGTDSVRVLLVDNRGGHLSEASSRYPRWAEGKYCDAAKNRFRHHPLDYLESLEESVSNIVAGLSPEEISQIRGISFDTTGSTPAAVNARGKPLALTEGFRENPNAMFILWKDHTAVPEAEEINRLSKNWEGPDYTKYSGGVYSAEWFWAKILHTVRCDEQVHSAAFSWAELCDWIPFELTGGTDVREMKRSRCAAGHKAMWHKEFDGLPSQKFLSLLDSRLDGVRDRLYSETFTADQPAGKISKPWAGRLGLPEHVIVGTGAFDAHMGAVGGEIEPYYLSKVMGTSTCDMLITPEVDLGDKIVKGICGQVDGSVIPGMVGLEAGQSSFGDVYAWYRDLLLWPVQNVIGKSAFRDRENILEQVRNIGSGLMDVLSDEAAKMEPNGSGMVALDWLNGRRTPDANQKLTAALGGLSLGSDAPGIFRALVEATCFGAKAITERFREEGIPVKGILGMGGVAKKSPFVMQTLADVLEMPIKIVRSEQTCALGACMFAAVACGMYDSVEEAKQAMGSGFDKTYHPDSGNAGAYRSLYRRYGEIGTMMERTGGS